MKRCKIIVAKMQTTHSFCTSTTPSRAQAENRKVYANRPTFPAHAYMHFTVYFRIACPTHASTHFYFPCACTRLTYGSVRFTVYFPCACLCAFPVYFLRVPLARMHFTVYLLISSLLQTGFNAAKRLLTLVRPGKTSFCEGSKAEVL